MAQARLLAPSAAAAPDEWPLLPLPGEPPDAYLVRLKGLHERIGGLIETIEARRPEIRSSARPARALSIVASAPVAAPGERFSREPRTERRLSTPDRRFGAPDRRRGAPDPRGGGGIERRFGVADRRRVPHDRRAGIERRQVGKPAPASARVSRVTVMWAVQVTAWIAIVVAVLAYGIHH